MKDYISEIYNLYKKSTDGLTFNIQDTVPDLISKLSKSPSKKAANMIEILSVGRESGLPDDFVISMMLIAGPESNWIPTAYNPQYGASGYFQLLPKYFSTARLSTSRKIIAAQLKQIYDKRTKGDLAVMYGHHFYQTLGIAYAKAPTIGLQLKSTYGQYVVSDVKGNSFHSPYLLALYCIAKFEAVAKVQLNISIPTVSPVIQVKESKKVSFFPITFGEGEKMFSVSNASSFKIASTSSALSGVLTGSIAQSLTSTLTLGPVSSIFGTPLYEGEIGDDSSYTVPVPDQSGDLVNAKISFGDSPTPAFYENMVSTYKEINLVDILRASFQSYIRAIDNGSVDVNTLRIILTQVLDPRVPLSTKDDLVIKSKSAISYLLADVSQLMQVIVGKGGDTAYLNMLALLLTNSSRLSHTTHYAQLQYHDTCAIDIKGSILPAVAYSTVLWPFSILCTPAFGSGPTVFRSAVPFSAAQSMLTMLDALPNPGTADLAPAAKGLINYDTRDVKRTANRIKNRNN